MFDNKSTEILGREIIFVNPAVNDASPQFFVERSGIINYEYCAEQIGKHAHTFYTLGCVVRGKGFLECEEDCHAVNTGDLYFISNDSPHIYHSEKNDPLYKCWINLGGSLPETIVKVNRMQNGAIVKQTDATDAFNKLILAMKNAKNDSDLLHAKTMYGVCELMNRFFNDAAENDHYISEKIKDYIADNVYRNIRLADLEKNFYYEKSHIINLFKKYYDITPKQYTLLKKIELSMQLLTEPSHCIKEIASMLCFSSSQHFSSVFKQVSGMSPDRYKRSLV